MAGLCMGRRNARTDWSSDTKDSALRAVAVLSFGPHLALMCRDYHPSLFYPKTRSEVLARSRSQSLMINHGPVSLTPYSLF